MYKCACDQTTTHTVNVSILPNLYVLYSVLMYVPLLSELFIYTMCMHVYIRMHTNMFVHICVHVCGNLQFISQYPTHSMYVVFYNVIYNPTYVHH